MWTKFKVSSKAQCSFTNGTILKSNGTNVAGAVADTDYIAPTSTLYVPQASLVDNGYSGSSKTVDWTQGSVQKITLTAAAVTLAFTAPGTKPARLTLIVIQSGTSSSSSSSTATDTITWPATVKWASGSAPTLATGTGKKDIIDFIFDGTSYYGRSILNVS